LVGKGKEDKLKCSEVEGEAGKLVFYKSKPSPLI